METAFAPVLNKAGTFHCRLGDPLPLRDIRITVQQLAAETLDNPVFRYQDSLKGITPMSRHTSLALLDSI
jgi:hypothetical protein